jgi:cell division protein ZapA
MLSIAAKAPNADSTRIAVLACLHLADQLRHVQQEVEDLRQRKDTGAGAGEYAAMLEKLITSLEELSA